MKLSNKGLYSLRVLRHLAEDYGKEPLSVAYLSREEGLPLKYLEQILSLLRKSGLLMSRRGKDGGYSLIRPPEEITVGDVIRAVEGPLAPLLCASVEMDHKKFCDCPHEIENCWIRLLMLQVRENISAVLDQYTLATMVMGPRSQESEAQVGMGGGVADSDSD
ncbi:MAG: Rrf2 family transcriptional regulator [Candidatus Eisenbacteria bacterium]|uniref:Rrf2 family transcriptional regulator n=1 Tax=Eiseniibacteriota bacterium TaxID=2212470 RepID=A0A948S009_UNCEI|nr:Rrf2 family transcriptional regulator [Candidatus Eisenbacteria bacterium]MBU1950179.1 Rrf2 family transcriptional regulator [Candidatus Eisenbacteria bacterium]MBU2692803.1 Rrf2 family transcriptional regulator [Candidatus Eisenbacteria bacterium]